MTEATGSLAARIDGGDTIYGVITKMPAPTIVEQIGHAGFDLVVLDTEHGGDDHAELEHHLRAADSAGVPALVRVGTNDPLLVLRALDAGAAGVIVPHVSSPEDARTAVRSAHYAPRGARGLAVSTRAAKYGTVELRDHLARAATETVVVAQIEDVGGATASAAIAATFGLNGVWIGPSDLSLSLGLPGQLDHPDVVATIDRISTNVVMSDSCALCVLVDSTDEAAAWRDRGARIVLFNATAIIASQLVALARGVYTDTGRAALPSRTA